MRCSQIDFESLVQDGAMSYPLRSPLKKDVDFVVRDVLSWILIASDVHHKPEFEIFDIFFALRVVANYSDVCCLTADELISFETHSGGAGGCSYAEESADVGDHSQAFWFRRAGRRVANVNRFTHVE